MTSEIKRLPPLLLPDADKVKDEKAKLVIKELVSILDEWRRKINLVYNWEDTVAEMIDQIDVSTVRRAKIQSVGASTLTCKLLDADGDETGSDIIVSPVKHLGSNDLTGEVWPDLAAGNVISIFQGVDDNHYTAFVFDDVCEC